MLEMVSNTFRDLFKLIMQKPTSPIKMQTVADIALTSLDFTVMQLWEVLHRKSCENCFPPLWNVTFP